MARYSYSIASGASLPLGSLTNIENIADSDGVNFYAPNGAGQYRSGAAKIRGDGLDYRSGFGTTEWAYTGSPHSKVTRKQDALLRTNYCSGGSSGTVVIYTKTDQADTYALFNAVMHLPDLPDAQPHFKGYGAYRIRFTRMVAL